MLIKPVAKIADFSGGHVASSPMNLAPNQTPDCLNVYSGIFKTLIKRNGYAKLNSVSQAAAGSGIYNFQRDDAFQYMMGMWGGTTFKKMDNAGHAIVTGDDATPTLGTGAYLKVTIDSAGGNWVFDDIDLISYPADVRAVINAINDATDTNGVLFTNVARAYEDTSGFLVIESKTLGTTSKIDVADGTSDTGDAQGETTQALFNGTTATDTGSAAAWDGTWDTIGVNTNRGTTFTAGATQYAHFTSFNNNAIATTEARDVPQQWDPFNSEADYVDIDWQTSHCYVVGDVDAVTPDPLITKSYLKITIDGTEFDEVDLDGDTSIDDVVDSINTHSGLLAKGFAYKDSNGYLRIISNTRGADGSVVVADGSSDDQEATEILFDGTTSTGTTIGTNIAPQGKYCVNWHDYVWIANTAANPDRVYYSASADHTSWTATDYQDIITPSDVGITGMAILHGRVYIFKKWSIHRVTYLGGTPLLDIKQVKSSVGTASPRSMVNVDIPGQGEVVMFLGTDLQMYAFDGYNATPVGEAVTNYNGISSYCLKGDGSTYGLNPKQLGQVHAVNHVDKHWYIMYFCLDDDTSPTDSYVYDYFTGAFWPNTYNDAFIASCVADDGTGRRVVYTAGTNYAWKQDSGNADDTVAINGYWDSAKIDGESEIYIKRFGNITVSTKSVACTPIVSVRPDWSSSYTALDTLVTATNVHKRDLPYTDNQIQVRFADNTTDAAFELYRMSISVRPMGEGN